MLSIHLNMSSLLARKQLGIAHSSIATSLERLSTGYKINRASDNAANLAISKGQSCQMSGTTVAQENTAQAANLLDLADGTLEKMQEIAGRIRTLSLQSMNGTYSDTERAMMQKEVEQLTQELYRQKNNCKFNEIDVFGKSENVPVDFLNVGGANGKTLPKKGVSGATGITGNIATSSSSGTHPVEQLSEEEAIAKGYTVIKTAADLTAMKSSGKYILMSDIDLTGVSWSPKTLNAGAEFNGNGYAITNFTISVSGGQGLFKSNSGLIENLSLRNAVVKGGGSTAALVSNNTASGVIRNCDILETVVTGVSGENFGGIAGVNSGKIEDSSFSGTINGRTHTGGVVGVNSASGTIINCKVSGNINGATSVGGVVGTNDGSVSSTFVEATINGTGSNCGGIIGNNRNANAKVLGCVSNSTITGTYYVGGIAGLNSATIANSKSVSDITASGGTVGGISGINSLLVSNCEAEGKINSSNRNIGGLVGENKGTIENSSTQKISVKTSAETVGGLVGTNSGTIKNASAKAIVSGTNNIGGFCGTNSGVIANSEATSTATGSSSYTGGFVGVNTGDISASKANSITSNNANVSSNHTGGFCGINNASGNITNCLAEGNTTTTKGLSAAGFVGLNSGTVTLSQAKGLTSGANNVSGFVGVNNNGAIIDECLSRGNVSATGEIAGGFVGTNNSGGKISNSYSTGDVAGSYYLGGFAGKIAGTVSECYSSGGVTQSAGSTNTYNGGFAGNITADNLVSNCFSSGVVTSQTGGGAFSYSSKKTENCYANLEQPPNISSNQSDVELKNSGWLNNSENLRFLGDAYDYFYSPPGLLNNKTDHPEEYTLFQIGSNSGEENMIDLNLVFRMDFYSANVSSVDNAEISIKNTDVLLDKISQKRSKIGATRNKLDSILQSQSVKLENLSSSHSTIMDTDFANETAKLTRQQILQQASASLLSQANTVPNIALSLLKQY